MRKKMVLVFALLLALTAVAATCATTMRRDRITWKNINRIKPGMTECRCKTSSVSQLACTTPPTRRFRCWTRAKCWVGDGAGVEVWFDQDARVVDTALFGVDRERNARHVTINWLRGALDSLDGKP